MPTTKDRVVVPSEGPLDCSIMFIGEAPGADEERQRRPFVGAAGELFTSLLASAGILRSACYITNVVKVRPKGNNISEFIQFKGKKVIKTEEYDEWEAELYKELEACTANVVVPLGNVPLYALRRHTQITKWRGSILEGPFKEKVIPVIHPAAALRQYNYQYFILHDLKRVLQQSKFSGIDLPNRKIEIRPTCAEALSWMLMCSMKGKVAFDIEVMNGQVSCFSLAVTNEMCMSIPLVERGNKTVYTVEEEASIMRELASILEDPNINIIGQNLAFDASFMFDKYGIRTVNIDDTMIAHGILLPDMPKGLDFLTSMYTNEPYFKDEGKVWKNPKITDEQFWRYNALDSLVCMEIFPKLKAMLEAQGNWGIYRRQVDLIQPILYMGSHGIRTNRAGMQAQSRKLVQEVQDLTEELHELAGSELNPSSPKQLMQYFYVTKGLTPYMKGGRPTTDVTALTRLKRRGIREAGIILDIRQRNKLRATYLDVEVDADNRLRASYNPVGTKNGRLSSSKTILGKGTNLQNIPEKTVRPYLLADSNYAVYSVDLVQAENMVVAYIAPEYNMIEAFEEGVDIHAQTARLIFQVEDVEQLAPEIGDGLHTFRAWGKRANHGLNYGLGYRKFSLINELPEREGQNIVERYHTIYPGVRQFHAWVQYEIGRTRTLTNCKMDIEPRVRKFLGRYGEDLFREAYNFIPQSTVADLINHRGLLFVYERQDLFEHVELLNQIHDSIVFQIPIKVGWEYHATVLQTICDNLQRPIEWKGREFSIPADVEMGVAMYPMYSVDVEDAGNLEDMYGRLKG